MNSEKLINSFEKKRSADYLSDNFFWSACREPNYHTKCGKNCHKILSVWDDLDLT